MASDKALEQIGNEVTYGPTTNRNGDVVKEAINGVVVKVEDSPTTILNAKTGEKWPAIIFHIEDANGKIHKTTAMPDNYVGGQ